MTHTVRVHPIEVDHKPCIDDIDPEDLTGYDTLDQLRRMLIEEVEAEATLNTKLNEDDLQALWAKVQEARGES